MLLLLLGLLLGILLGAATIMEHYESRAEKGQYVEMKGKLYKFELIGDDYHDEG